MQALAAALVLLLQGSVHFLEKPARYATDKAGVVPAERLQALNESLAAFERETSSQIVVYIDRRGPPNATIEEVAAALCRSWGIGQKGRSNGVLFLVFVDDRAMRIEVGYGLEGAIPDAIAKRITSEVVKPLFKKGDYAGGVEAGTRALMAAARGEGFAGTGRTVAETPRPSAPFEPWTLVPTILAGFVGFVIGLFRRPATRRSVSGVLATASAFATLAALVTAALTAQPAVWILAGVLLATTLGLYFLSFILAATSAISRPTRRRSSDHSSSSYASGSSDDSSASSSSDSSSDSSSSSSSDFSGGGGDSGGGGSSDSW